MASRFGGQELEMDWEFWTKQLDEEVLVENGEFGTRGVFVGQAHLQLFEFSFSLLIKSALCSVINVLNVVRIQRNAVVISC